MTDHHLLRAVADAALGVGFDQVIGGPTAEDVAEAVLIELQRRCRNCGHPVVPSAASSTNWTHGRVDSDWQGVRCPRRVTGATPMVAADLLAEFTDAHSVTAGGDQ